MFPAATNVRDDLPAVHAPEPVPIKVFLADDQPLVRAGIATLLAAQPDITILGEADDGHQAVRLVRALQPDVVIMDADLPVIDGIEATAHVTGGQAGADRPRVLILTAHDGDELAYAALRAGASGFMLKQAAAAELTRAVRAVAAGDGWLDPGVTGRLLREFATRPVASRCTPPDLERLTPREREVLELIGHGLSNGEIATHLFIGPGTVKTHYSRILIKLGLHNRAQAVITAFRSGLVGLDDHPPPGQRATVRRGDYEPTA